VTAQPSSDTSFCSHEAVPGVVPQSPLCVDHGRVFPDDSLHALVEYLDFREDYSSSKRPLGSFATDECSRIVVGWMESESTVVNFRDSAMRWACDTSAPELDQPSRWGCP